MEYYGKILCISYNDLTYDDRPVMVNGKADYSRSRTLKGVHPSTLSEEELAPIMSIPNYKKLAAKEKINVVRSGRGLGGYVLVEIATCYCHILITVRVGFRIQTCLFMEWRTYYKRVLY